MVGIHPGRLGMTANSRRADSVIGLLLDVKEAAQLIGWTEKTIRHHVARHILPYKKRGKRVYFEREVLLQFIHDLPGVTLEEAQRIQEARNR